MDDFKAWDNTRRYLQFGTHFDITGDEETSVDPTGVVIHGAQKLKLRPRFTHNKPSNFRLSHETDPFLLALQTGGRKGLQGLKCQNLYQWRQKQSSRATNEAGLTWSQAKVSVNFTRLIQPEKPDLLPIGKEADELDRSARAEAQRLLKVEKGDYKFDYSGFYALSLRSSTVFSQRVLTHLPFELLSSICDLVRSDFQYAKVNWKKLLSPHVLNESLLRDLLNRRRLWIREFGGDECLPESKLISVFDASGTAPRHLWSRKRLDIDFRAHATFDQGLQAKVVGDVPYGYKSVVPSLDLFRICFDCFTSGMFRGVEFDGKIAIAGSAVMACLLPLPKEVMSLYREYVSYRRSVRQSLSTHLPLDLIENISQFWGNPAEAKLRSALGDHYNYGEHFFDSDIDVFLVVKNFEEAEWKIRTLYGQIVKNLPVSHCVVRTANTITICSELPYRHIQIVLSCCNSIEQHLVAADLDCTCSAYDGNNVYALPRTVRAFNYRCNFVEPIVLQNPETPGRIYKYNRRGFPSLIHELCKHNPRCDLGTNPRIQQIFKNTSEAIKVYEDNQKRRYRRIWEPRSAASYADIILPYGHGIDAARIKERIASRLQAWSLRAHAEMAQTEEEMKTSRSNEKEERMQVEGDVQEMSEEDSVGVEVPLPPSPTYSAADTLSELFQEPDMHSMDDELEEFRGTTLPKVVPIPFRWKWETSRGLHKPPPRVQPVCYICNKTMTTRPDSLLGANGTTTAAEQLPKELGLCDACDSENKKHREHVANLHGKVALVTGGRIKIGYHIALKLLRCGATVIVVTRFPRDAARKFLTEPDAAFFRDRIHIYGVDLRHLGMVNSFIAHVKTQYHRLDILINNAAQTVRRPPAYYRGLCKKEIPIAGDGFWVPAVVKRVGEDPWRVEPDAPTDSSNLLEIEAILRSFPLISGTTAQASVPENALVAQITKFSKVTPSAVLTQLPLVSSDVLKDSENFPKNEVDIYGEQLDLRKCTSWVKKAEDVEPVEVAETQLVNSVVPFMFVSQLTDLLSKTPEPSFIVNVSSPEGQFSSVKSGEHVHTNMAKAALNMMTLTVAPYLALKNIHVTSVDTGWVSRMRPGQPVRNSVAPPLSCADGAARVLHPVFHGLSSGKPLSGVFLRNFVVTSW